MLVMSPSKILLLLVIIPLRKIHVVSMRFVFPPVVINHLAMIPHMIIVLPSIVVPRLALAPTDHKHRATHSGGQHYHRKMPQ